MVSIDSLKLTLLKNNESLHLKSQQPYQTQMVNHVLQGAFSALRFLSAYKFPSCIAFQYLRDWKWAEDT